MVTFGNPPPGYAIRVMKAFEGQNDEFTGGATSAPVNPPSVVGGLQEFAADVPIEVRDYVGLDVPVNGTVSLGAGPSGSYRYFNPTLPVGETRSTGVFSPQLAFNAEIKPRPEVKAIGPTIGPVAGGTLVTIAGTELGDVVGVNAVAGTSPKRSAGVRTGRVVKQRPEGGASVPIGTKIVVTLRKPGK